MATPQFANLEQQATQQINPFLKGLSMLTGGIAGELTGTNEQIRQQRQARRALLEENLAALQQERMMERMDAFEAKRLKRQLEFDEAQRLAATRARVAQARGEANVMAGRDVMGPLEPAEEAGMEIARANIARAEAERIRGLEAARPEMTGYLAAQGVQTGEPDIETLQFLTSQQRAKEAIQKEARQAKREEGQVYISRNAEGQVSVQGPADKVAEYQKANPDLFSKQKGAPYRIRLQPGMEGNQLFADFGDMTTEEIEKIQPDIVRLQKMYGGSVFSDGGETETKTTKSLIKGPAAEKGAKGAAQVGRGTGEARGRAAAAIASEMAAAPTPEMYGPPSPGEQFIQTGRRLGVLEARGGPATYHEKKTLTSPF